LRGHLAGARVAADLTRCGDTVVLTGPELPDGPLVCRVDRHGPGATALDEPLAQAACGLMAVHGWGRGRRAARLGVDYVTTSTGVALAQGVLAGLLARLRGSSTRGVTVSMAATALLAVSPYLAAGTTGTPDPPARLGSGSRPGVAAFHAALYHRGRPATRRIARRHRSPPVHRGGQRGSRCRGGGAAVAQACRATRRARQQQTVYRALDAATPGTPTSSTWRYIGVKRPPFSPICLHVGVRGEGGWGEAAGGHGGG
jgi:hypothetical protein